jgi:hypothetical protein
MNKIAYITGYMDKDAVEQIKGGMDKEAGWLGKAIAKGKNAAKWGLSSTYRAGKRAQMNRAFGDMTARLNNTPAGLQRMKLNARMDKFKNMVGSNQKYLGKNPLDYMSYDQFKHLGG